MRRHIRGGLLFGSFELGGGGQPNALTIGQDEDDDDADNVTGIFLVVFLSPFLGVFPRREEKLTGADSPVTTFAPFYHFLDVGIDLLENRIRELLKSVNHGKSLSFMHIRVSRAYNIHYTL